MAVSLAFMAAGDSALVKHSGGPAGALAKTGGGGWNRRAGRPVFSSPVISLRVHYGMSRIALVNGVSYAVTLRDTLYNPQEVYPKEVTGEH